MKIDENLLEAYLRGFSFAIETFRDHYFDLYRDILVAI